VTIALEYTLGRDRSCSRWQNMWAGLLVRSWTARASRVNIHLVWAVHSCSYCLHETEAMFAGGFKVLSTWARETSPIASCSGAGTSLHSAGWHQRVKPAWAVPRRM